MFFVLLALIVSCTAQCFDSSDILPIPLRSVGPKVPNTKYYVGNLWAQKSSAIYWATNGVYNFMFITYNNGVVVFDAPAGPTKFALAAVRSTTNNPITHFVYTTSHNPDIGDANDFYSNQTKFIANEYVNSDFLNRRNASTLRVPLPDIIYVNSYNFTVGSDVTVNINLLSPNIALTPGDIIVWLPDQNIIMDVDFVFPRWAPEILPGEIPMNIIQNYQYILSFPFVSYVGGRVGLIGDRNDILEQQAYLNDLIATSQKYLTLANTSAYTSLLTSGNYIAYMRAVNDQLSCSCAQELVNRWSQQLAGVDVYGQNECLAMQQLIRMEGPPLATAHPENAPPPPPEVLPPVIVECSGRTTFSVSVLSLISLLAMLDF